MTPCTTGELTESNVTDRLRDVTGALPVSEGVTVAWPETEKLKYEKEVLDFYFSSHPLAQFEKELSRLNITKVENLKRLLEAPQGATV